jgi:hypothetical protein
LESGVGDAHKVVVATGQMRGNARPAPVFRPSDPNRRWAVAHEIGTTVLTGGLGNSVIATAELVGALLISFLD